MALMGTFKIFIFILFSVITLIYCSHIVSVMAPGEIGEVTAYLYAMVIMKTTCTIKITCRNLNLLPAFQPGCFGI